MSEINSIPWFAFMYLIFFAVFGAAGIWTDVAGKKPKWFISIAVLVNVFLMYVYIAYWNTFLLKFNGVFLMILLACCLTWEVFQLWDDCREDFLEKDTVTDKIRTLGVPLVAMLLCLPMYFVCALVALSA